MSHTVTIEVEFRDAKALEAACKRIGATCELNGQAKLFDGQVHKGHIVKLKGWRYPVIVDESGHAHFDDYKGRWGNVEDLKKLKQAYGAEAAKRVARRQGFRVSEKVLTNGKIQVRCTR